MSNEQIAAVDKWAAAQADTPDRSEALRRLVARGLASDVRRQGHISPKAAARAEEMAGQELDHLGDQTTPPDERARRKRRLLKGPKEFRD